MQRVNVSSQLFFRSRWFISSFAQLFSNGSHFRASLASLAMFNKIENPFNRPVANDSSYLDVVFQLLDSLNDKDDQVRATAEASLIKIADKKPDEIVLFVCDYKKKAAKLTDQAIAVILR